MSTEYAPAVIARFWAKVDRGKSCWLWVGSLTATGYGQFALRSGHPVRAHAFAYQLTHGKPPAGSYILHRCDTRHCVNPSHLYAGTQADNIRDCHARGRAAIGEQHGTHFLTEEDVRTMRALQAAGHSYSKIAKAYGVAIHTAWAAITRKTWKHVI